MNDAYLRYWEKARVRAKKAQRANGMIAYHIKHGKLKRQPCEICGLQYEDGYRIEAHHDDYDKPLDVKWLCTVHHNELHNKLGTKKRRHLYDVKRSKPEQPD